LTALVTRGLSGAGRALLAVVIGWFARVSPTRSGVVIVYHRVGGAGSGNEDLEILPAVGSAVFERQLRHLRRHYRVVPAVEILQAVRTRRRGRRFPVAITFDDDLPEHLGAALPALRNAGVPATFFLTGASLEGPHAFWWEDLQRAIDGRLVEPEGVPHVDVTAALERSPRAILDLAGEITRLPSGQRHEVAVALREALGPPPAESGLRARDVRALADGGCAIGFHTFRHEVLPALTDAELERALTEGRETLEEAAGAPIEAIAYPHGKADDRVAAAARRAGFALGFTTARGPVTAETDPFRIPRTVADLEQGSLELRLARMLFRRGPD
jgi:peptidoglycan/xylan/chitin deacetylase (PgdA/CDA1 family)